MPTVARHPSSIPLSITLFLLLLLESVQEHQPLIPLFDSAQTVGQHLQSPRRVGTTLVKTNTPLLLTVDRTKDVGDYPFGNHRSQGCVYETEYGS